MKWNEMKGKERKWNKMKWNKIKHFFFKFPWCDYLKRCTISYQSTPIGSENICLAQTAIHCVVLKRFSVHICIPVTMLTLQYVLEPKTYFTHSATVPTHILYVFLMYFNRLAFMIVKSILKVILWSIFNSFPPSTFFSTKVEILTSAEAFLGT